MNELPVSTAVHGLLETFESLTEPERYEAAIELLPRVASPAELTDETLVAVADDVFRELDEREAADASP